MNTSDVLVKFAPDFERLLATIDCTSDERTREVNDFDMIVESGLVFECFIASLVSALNRSLIRMIMKAMAVQL